MKKKADKTHSAGVLFVLVTFLIYAGAMVLLVYMGTVVYRSVTDQMEQHFSTRTAQAYITEKIRQNDRSGMISAEEIDGRSVLVFREMVEDRSYVTYIYEDAGQLKELFTREGSSVTLENGTGLLKLQGFYVEELEGNGFRIQLTDEAQVTREFIVFQDSEEQEEIG